MIDFEGVEAGGFIEVKQAGLEQYSDRLLIPAPVQSNYSRSEVEKKKTIFIVHASDFLTDYRSHGDGLVAFGFIKNLADHGHRLLVATSQTDLREALPTNVTVFPLPGRISLPPWSRIEYMIRVRLLFEELKRSHSIDLVHQMNPVFTGLSLSMVGCGLPVVLGTFVPDWPVADVALASGKPKASPRLAFAKKLISVMQQRLASALVLTSPAAFGRIPCRQRVASKIFSLQHGIDTQMFSPWSEDSKGTCVQHNDHDKNSQDQNKSEVKEDCPPSILFYANVLERKGVFVLMRAFEEMALSAPRCRLAIAGSGPDLWKAKRYVASMQSRSRIDFLGHVDHSRAPELLRRHSVYCLPSFGEPYGMTVLEAMSCGKPIVASNAGGIPYLVPKDGGRLVPMGDAPALAAALLEVVNDPELQLAMGRANRKRAEEMFAWPQVTGQLEKIYEHVLQPRTHRHRTAREHGRRTRHLIKAVTPAVLRDYRTRWLVSKSRQKSCAQPVAEVFCDVYRNRQRTSTDTDTEQDLSSGPGSAIAYAQPYCDWVSSFVRDNKITRVVDLGCGDFRIGRTLTASGDFDYLGVDIVPELIANYRARFGDSKVRFECLNIIDDDLPPGELCLIRQVFQHLSNQEILFVLEKCSAYSYVLITEHVYIGEGSRPNVDKPHGPDTRVYDRSGVFLDKAPFDLPTRTVLELPYADGEVLQSVLLERL
jgi:glycosyltransferase involved in cell wall biosynthesis/SAM-dependent methyltransferase